VYITTEIKYLSFPLLFLFLSLSIFLERTILFLEIWWCRKRIPRKREEGRGKRVRWCDSRKTREGRREEKRSKQPAQRNESRKGEEESISNQKWPNNGTACRACQGWERSTAPISLLRSGTFSLLGSRSRTGFLFSLLSFPLLSSLLSPFPFLIEYGHRDAINEADEKQRADAQLLTDTLLNLMKSKIEEVFLSASFLAAFFPFFFLVQSPTPSL